MTTVTKPLLGPYLREILTKKYDTISNAAFNLGFPYQGLKKSLQSSHFTEIALKQFFPDTSVKELEDKYFFTIGRTNSKRAPSSPTFQSWDFVGASDLEFIRDNRIVAERVANVIHEECERLRAALGVT